MSHDTTLHWAEQGFDLQTGFTVTPDDDGLVVSGDCPRCKGSTSWPFRKGEMGAMDQTDADAARSETATVICACGHPHEKRPDGSGEDGCGAYWKVLL